MKNCKTCTERYEGCQDRCPSLIGELLARDDYKNEREKDKLSYHLLKDSARRAYEHKKVGYVPKGYGTKGRKRGI